MLKMIFLHLISIFVLLSPLPVFAADFTESPAALPGVILAADLEGPLPLGEILQLDTNHLLVLGTGVLVGATVIGPYLGISELVAIGVGGIAGEIVYRSGLWLFEKPRGWLQ